VDVRAPEVGQLAARTIIARIDGEKPKSTVLAPRLIERESVRHL
jgi:DNA-binding LacI/PurR family transcriptional regulator